MPTVIDVDEPDHHLAWPRDAVVGELQRRLRRAQRGGGDWDDGMGRLLRSAFKAPALAEEFEAFDGNSHPLLSSRRQWVQALVADLADVPPFPPVRAYWSQRSGTTEEEHLGTEQVMDRFVLLVARLDRDESLWAERFGVNCPDGVGDPIGTPDQQIEELLQRRIGERGPWPLGVSRDDWDLADLFDLIEVLHDLASWPAQWSGHNFGGCIGHPYDCSSNLGQALYRYQVNQLLEQSTLGVRIADAGEDRGRVVRSQGPQLDAAVEGALAKPLAGFETDVAHAIAQFRARDRTVPAMRGAIVTLAGALEEHRALLKETLISKDEGALFDIANNFDIRHRDAKQKRDYDPRFLEWIFTWYLATINLIRELVDERTPTTAPSSGPESSDFEPF